jgi:hypothetical protein
MPKVLQLDSRDNLLIALTDLRQGETVGHNAGTFTLFSSVPAKHDPSLCLLTLLWRFRDQP